MKTFASLFSGFGGADLGAIAAGMQPAWGVEYDAKIAEVGNANLGNHIKVANILDCNPRDFERVDVLHASPVCTSFSVAKTNGTESALDIACASKVAEFVTTLQPEIFTLENVQAYKKSKSWHIINEALNNAGYWLNIEICNSANYSVPQTRKRMIVRAIRGGFVPYLPQPEPWIGWYAAIEDLIPTLPDTQFAPWQLARLPEELRTMLVAQGKYGKAFIIDCQNAGNPSPDRGRLMTIRSATQPMFTVTSSMMPKRPCRAFDGGRVVAMNTRALARFQSFPDQYLFPDSKTLAAKGIGNAVPPLMMEKIYRGLLS